MFDIISSLVWRGPPSLAANPPWLGVAQLSAAFKGQLYPDYRKVFIIKFS